MLIKIRKEVAKLKNKLIRIKYLLINVVDKAAGVIICTFCGHDFGPSIEIKPKTIQGVKTIRHCRVCGEIKAEWKFYGED